MQFAITSLFSNALNISDMLVMTLTLTDSHNVTLSTDLKMGLRLTVTVC